MIDRNEVDAMARILRAMNGEGDMSDAPAPRGTNATPVPVNEDAANVDAMRNILMRLQSATEETATGIARDAAIDPRLREALNTERTLDGARIGKWEITFTEEGKRRYYDIRRVGEDEVIARDLTLFEAALGVVRVLNEGGAINSNKALSILLAEQRYAKALTDAIHFARLLKRNTNSVKRDIYEARYSEAKSRALTEKAVVLREAGPYD